MHHPGEDDVGWQLHRPETAPIGWHRKQFVWPASADVVIRPVMAEVAAELSDERGRPFSDCNPLDLGTFLEVLCARHLIAKARAENDPGLTEFEED